MTSSFRAEVPGQPPSVNHIHRVVWRERPDGTRYKGRAKTEVAADYISDVWKAVRAAKPRGWMAPAYNAKAGTGLIYLDVHLHLRFEADADNLGKLICDGVKHALNCDDDQFLIRFQSKRIGVRQPYIEIEVIP